jgi:hypothetical protein
MNCCVIVQGVEFKDRTLQRDDSKDHFAVSTGESLQLLGPQQDTVDEFAEQGSYERRGCAPKLFAPLDEGVDGDKQFAQNARTKASQPSCHSTPGDEIRLRGVPPHHLKLGTRAFLGYGREMTVTRGPLLRPERGVVRPIPHI